MSSIQMTPVEPVKAAVGEIPPVFLPLNAGRYTARAARLRQLTEGHPMADYLGFVAGLVEAQQRVLETLPLPPALIDALPDRLGQDHPPLECSTFPRDAYWLAVLRQLGEHLEHPTLQGLLQQNALSLEAAADALLAGDYEQVDSGQALFLWSALSLYFSQLAAHLPASGKAHGEQRQHCPVCASAPVASSILTGAHSGLRYLHCGLCESRWHMVRLKCSNCEATGALDYWSLDSEKAPVKAESCGECQSYLKVFYPEHDKDLEVLADDLASLGLDAEVEREGFGRSGVSPFLFPG
ncbi:formate dehydrogenase accessory protein FdhE [Pseudomonas sp. Irchel 3E13]|uniref:formate dehydrogenase accessory protein FdhE n=1 Tax=Pseudomonas sp. Irchel 3E13 TaxID=2008975 RepID=UPI000BA41F56|nr:formate dehydrogenase accessory protein FdhE [Pseudomonas sp. Irchel 3E13]